MGLETLPTACYILSDESSIPFYSTSNGYNNSYFQYIQVTLLWWSFLLYLILVLELCPHLNDEANVDSVVNTLESVLVSAAGVSTPQSTSRQCNQKKTNLQIEQLVLKKRS